MIRTAKIDNFKIFKKFEISDIPRLLIIGGRNGTGKTSVLEGLFAFFDRNNPFFISRLLQWRGISSVALTPEAFWGPSFRDRQLDRPITIELEDEFQKRQKLEIR